MGAFWGRRIEIVTTLSEITGYKSGLALTRREITSHLPEFGEWVSGADEDLLRVRSEEFEEIVRWLLYRLGTIPTPHVLFPGIAQYHKYRSDPRKSAIQAKIL